MQDELEEMENKEKKRTCGNGLEKLREQKEKRQEPG